MPFSQKVSHFRLHCQLNRQIGEASHIDEKTISIRYPESYILTWFQYHWRVKIKDAKNTRIVSYKKDRRALLPIVMWIEDANLGGPDLEGVK